jgi:hypothetical protein
MAEFEHSLRVDGVSNGMKPTYIQIDKLSKKRARTDLTTGSN